MELFSDAEVARGYAASRPRFHAHVLRQVRSALGLETPLGQALDVGCGAGLSTAPLLALARSAVGLLDESLAPLFGGSVRGLRFGGTLWILDCGRR